MGTDTQDLVRAAEAVQKLAEVVNSPQAGLGHSKSVDDAVALVSDAVDSIRRPLIEEWVLVDAFDILNLRCAASLARAIGSDPDSADPPGEIACASMKLWDMLWPSTHEQNEPNEDAEWSQAYRRAARLAVDLFEQIVADADLIRAELQKNLEDAGQPADAPDAVLA